MNQRSGSVRNSGSDSGATEKRELQHGDRLPDTDRSTDRVFVSYPMTEAPDAKAARIKAGKPAPLLQFVVGTIRGSRA